METIPIKSRLKENIVLILFIIHFVREVDGFVFLKPLALQLPSKFKYSEVVFVFNSVFIFHRVFEVTSFKYLWQ